MAVISKKIYTDELLTFHFEMQISFYERSENYNFFQRKEEHLSE